MTELRFQNVLTYQRTSLVMLLEVLVGVLTSSPALTYSGSITEAVKFFVLL